MGTPTHREACQNILAHLFGREIIEIGSDQVVSDSFGFQNSSEHAGTQAISKSKVLKSCF